MIKEGEKNKNKTKAGLPPHSLPHPLQDPEVRALPVEEIKKLMRREKNKKMAAFSRTKNMLHVSQLEDTVRCPRWARLERCAPCKHCSCCLAPRGAHCERSARHDRGRCQP